MGCDCRGRGGLNGGDLSPFLHIHRMEEKRVRCMIIWALPEDFKVLRLMLQAQWRHVGLKLIEEYDEDEGYLSVDLFEQDDGSRAEVFCSDLEGIDVADIRLFMAIDDDEKEEFERAYREYMEGQGLEPGEPPFMRYLYEKALGK